MGDVKIDWGRLAVFLTVAVCLTVLIAMGKLDAKYFELLFTWAIPSPLKFGEGKKED